MAVRDRNLFAWQAYVLTMTIVSVGLLLALGYVIFAGSTSKKQALEATQKYRELDEKLKAASIKMQYMSYMLGAKQSTEQEVEQMKGSITGDAEMENVKKTYESDMALFGAETPLQDRNYSSLVGSLIKSLRTRNLEKDKSSKDIVRLTNEVESIRIQETKGRESAEAERDRLSKELELARDDYKKKEGELSKEIAQLTAEKTTAQNNFTKREGKFNQDLANLKQENAKLLKFKDEVVKNNIENEEREDFESAQGRIVSVDQNGVIVQVNLGRKQGVTTGRKFSVLNADSIRVSEATPKAQIEITRVIDDNQSLAKVLSDRKNVPVISDDLIYSPTFKPYGKVKFALLGKLDIDGDGIDDRQRVRSLIEQSNGEIVEDVGPDTKQEIGKMDIYTRYLVIGEMPKTLEGKSGDPRALEIGTRYSKVRARARELSIGEMPLEKLLGYLIKHNDEDRTVGLGDAIRSDDFKERPGPIRSSMEARDAGKRPSPSK